MFWPWYRSDRDGPIDLLTIPEYGYGAIFRKQHGMEHGDLPVGPNYGDRIGLSLKVRLAHPGVAG